METFSRLRKKWGLHQDSLQDDLRIDELADLIEAASVPRGHLESLVLELLSVLPAKADSDVRESLMNLLSEAYLQVGVQANVDEYLIRHVADMPPGEAVHAIAMLAESSRPESRRLLRDLARTSDTALRQTASGYLKGHAHRCSQRGER